MAVIFSLIALVALISLYDYFTARSWNQVTSSIRNEMVFEHRNQEYGAYQLRQDYDKRLVLIMAGFFLAIGVTYGTYMIIKNLPEEKLPPPPVDTSQFTVNAPPIEEDMPPPPPEEPPPPMEKAVAFTPPVIVDIEVDEDIKTQDELKDENVQKEDVEGEEGWNNQVIVEEEKKPEVVEEKPEEVLTFVEEEASYKGGYAAMMKYIQDNLEYPQVAVENNIQGKCYLKFVVEKDGQISNVSVARGLAGCPECDKAAMKVIRSMPPWTAGKNGGKPVRSWFQIPINFALE
jgi:protein TonB